MTCIVIVANVKLLISSFEVTIQALFLITGSIAVYLVSFWFITYYSAEADDFGVFVELFINSKTYMSMAFFMSSYVLVDYGMHYTSIEVRSMSERRKTRALYEAKLKEIQKTKKDTSIKTQINTIKSKFSFLVDSLFLCLDRGFAFSGEAGNDKLITESLTNRLQKALHKKLFANQNFAQI